MRDFSSVVEAVLKRECLVVVVIDDHEELLDLMETFKRRGFLLSELSKYLVVEGIPSKCKDCDLFDEICPVCHTGRCRGDGPDLGDRSVYIDGMADACEGAQFGG